MPTRLRYCSSCGYHGANMCQAISKYHAESTMIMYNVTLILLQQENGATNIKKLHSKEIKGNPFNS